MKSRSAVAVVAAAAALAVASMGTPLTSRPAAQDDSTWLKPLVLQEPAAVRATGFDSPPTNASCQFEFGTDCYRPAQIQAAYDTAGLYAEGTDGTGQTICIVDSFGSPTITKDVNTFSDTFNLPHPKLTIVQPAGRVPRYDGSQDRSGWAGETSLDVEWSHALAPGADIVLIETPTSETEGIHGFPEIAKAMSWAVAHEPCDVISQSYGATEPTFASKSQVLKLRDTMFKPAAKRGITILASAGDDGATDFHLDERSLYATKVDSWPSTDPLVTSVGGTRLHLTGSGKRTAADTAWGGVAGDDAGGGGLSSLFTRPAFQNGVKGTVGNHRGTPDISLDADPLSSLVTYESFDRGSPWHVEAGTSAASPMLAGIVALATQLAGHRIGWLDPLLYGPLTQRNASAKNGIIDITRGNNNVNSHIDADGSSSSLRGYTARHGYDLATGLGTIDAGKFVPALVAATQVGAKTSA